MRDMRQRLGVAEIAFCLLGMRSFAWAQGQPVSFSATGDIPYGTSEISIFQQQIDNHNKYSPSKFLVHVGDILSGSESCNETRYALVADMLKDLAVPAYIVPGDNETSDCSNPTQGMSFWLKYFTNFEQNFCGAPATDHQGVRVENFAFTLDGVLFIGINLVGGSGTNTTAQQQDADWVGQQFQSKVSQVRAAVVLAQAGPGGNRSTFFNRFVQSAAAFAKPVLFLHGDGHSWIQDNPWSLSNTMRIQVENGSAEDPVEVTVTLNTSTPSTTFMPKRKPWSSHIVVNMPPCAAAGPDQTIMVTASANLQGGATDDGDPNGSLSTTWSMASGPGTVTFGNTGMLATTATFDVGGIYVLRLTANDGVLQRSDDMTITVEGNGIPQNGVPAISSFTPTSGAVGTVVTIAGSNFTGMTNVSFNGTTASNFTANSNSQISATVPAGATTGKISATNSAGTAFSPNDFTVTTAPTQYTLTASTAGSGSVNLSPVGGVYDAGTVVTLMATPASGWQFSGWSGDLTGSNNPATITMNANKNVTATFATSGTGGLVVHEETRTGGSSSSSTVATAASLTAASGQLYLAAISTKPRIAVSNVSGLGLTWTLVKSQCSGRDQTGIEVWMAQGTASGNGTVTATLAVAASNAAIAVSRYSGVATTSPVGNVISGNTAGVNVSCTSGSDNNAYAFNLSTSASGAMAYGAAAMRHRTHTPGAGYTERGEIIQGASTTGSAASVAVEDKGVASPSTVIVNGTFSGSVDWAVVALEIRPQSGGVGGPSQNTLTVNTVGSGNVNLSPAGGVYDAGTVVTLTATAASGWQFSGWSGDLTGSTNPATISMNANKNVTATFTQLPATQYTLSATTVGSGSVTLNPAGGVYNAGTVVTLTASPASGWQFSGWSGALTGTTNPATITMNANKNVTATFTQLPATQYTLTATTVGSGNVNLSPAGSVYDAGTVVTLTATAASGWQFSGWSGDLTGSNNPATISMNANKNVTATFTTSGSSGQVAHEETRTGGSSSSSTVATAASLTAASGQLYLAAISTKPRIAVSNVSGLGLTWTLVKSQCSGRDQTGIEVWMAQGTASGNGTVTAMLAVAASNAAIAVSRYSGVATTSPVGNVISGNTAGVNVSCTSGSDNNAYAFNLSTSVDGAMAYGAAAMRHRTHTPGAGYTERGEIIQGASTTGSAAGVAVEDKNVASPSTVIVNGAFNGSVDWAVVALEIKPETGMAKSGSTAENPAAAPPAAFQLEQNYPNPFNPSTAISFEIPLVSQVTLKIYNETGQLVRTLVDAEMAAGRHVVSWNGRNRSGNTVAAGIYLYRIIARDEGGNAVFMQMRRMTFLK